MKLNERQACQLLGLAAPTTLDKARKAYRKLAQEFHPDRGGDEERFKQISVAYQYLVDLYENASQSTTQKTKKNTNTRRKKSTSHKDTYHKSSTSRKTQSQRKKTNADQNKQKSKTEDADHRQAWRDWREQVERSTETGHEKHSKQSTTQSKDRYEKSQSHSQSESQYTHTDQQQSKPNSQADYSSTEVVEAAVVPTLGDTIRRWGEEVGGRLSEATEGISQKLNRWYRKSSRSIFEKGTDEKLRLNVDLTTTLHGKQVRIAIQRFVPCPNCQVKDGVLRKAADTPASQWAENCQSCHETGRVIQREELSVYIPPGADRGNKLKVNDKGSAGLNGAQDGHLYLILVPEDLPQGFRRNGSDVELTQAVSTELLSRGGVLPIKTLRGSLNIKVPPNFQSGKKLLIPEQGFPVWSDPQKIGKLIVCLRAIR